MKCIIIGNGALASSTKSYLRDIEVDLVDDTKDVNWKEYDFGIICVEADSETEDITSDIDFYVSILRKNNVTPVIRTTLPVGYIETGIIYWPSFITHDSWNEQRIVMSMEGYYKGFHKYVTEPVHFLSLSDAIYAKLFSNLYLATRAEFFNTLADFVDDAPAVINAICADNRIGNFYNYPERKKFRDDFKRSIVSLAQSVDFAEFINETNNKRGE